MQANELLKIVFIISAFLLSHPDETAKKIDHYLTQIVAVGFSGAVLVAIYGKIILSKGYGSRPIQPLKRDFGNSCCSGAFRR
jgi:hypothetical protein